MPRTSAVESPGCPPLRALTTDVLGLVKVVESRAKDRVAKVVDTWGPPDASRGIVAASFSDHETQPLIAVARKNNLIEILNPMNGQSFAASGVGEFSSSGHPFEDDPIVGLHFLNTKRIELSCRSNVLLFCTEKGKASMRSFAMADASHGSSNTDSQSVWNICSAGKVICSSVNANEKYALFGGKGIEVNVWDLDKCSKTWTAKPPPKSSLGIFSPTWFTAATFLSKEDHRKIVAGTINHQVRLYDISSQRRPVTSISFRETPIKAVAADLDGHAVYIGTGAGDLAYFDMRTGKLLGCFVGKCCGSIRSIARHPELPILASCGLDRYLRIWDAKTRQLLSAVFLKQHLTNVMIDSHFSDEECAGNSAEQHGDKQAVEQSEPFGDDDDGRDDDDDDGGEEELLFVESKRSKKKEDKNKPAKTEESKKGSEDDQVAAEDHSLSLGEDEAEKMTISKRRKSSSSSEARGRSKKEKQNKRKKASGKE